MRACTTLARKLANTENQPTQSNNDSGSRPNTTLRKFVGFEKAKGRGKFTFNGVEVGKRKDFLNEVTPRIHGMSKKDRIFFAVMDGVTVKVDKQQKYVQAFSEGYIDCLFVSPTGVVGIDYKSCSPSYMICIDHPRCQYLYQ